MVQHAFSKCHTLKNKLFRARSRTATKFQLTGWMRVQRQRGRRTPQEAQSRRLFPRPVDLRCGRRCCSSGRTLCSRRSSPPCQPGLSLSPSPRGRQLRPHFRMPQLAMLHLCPQQLDLRPPQQLGLPPWRTACGGLRSCCWAAVRRCRAAGRICWPTYRWWS